MKTTGILVLVGYYVVALAGLAGWTYRDHASTKRRVDASPHRSDRFATGFATRVGVLLGVLAAIGAALLLVILLTPAPAVWVTAIASLGTGIVTFAVTKVVLQMSRGWFGVDPLADLRGSIPTVAPTQESGTRGADAP